MRKCKGKCTIHELGKNSQTESDSRDLAGKYWKMHSGEELKFPVGDLKRNPRRQMNIPLASFRPVWSSLRHRYELIWKAGVCHRLETGEYDSNSFSQSYGGITLVHFSLCQLTLFRTHVQGPLK